MASYRINNEHTTVNNNANKSPGFKAKFPILFSHKLTLKLKERRTSLESHAPLLGNNFYFRFYTTAVQRLALKVKLKMAGWWEGKHNSRARSACVQGTIYPNGRINKTKLKETGLHSRPFYVGIKSAL